MSALTAESYSEETPGSLVIGGQPWRLSRRILEPLWMPHRDLAVDDSTVLQEVRASGALLARWSSGWDDPNPGPWWWTCCDLRDYRIDAIDSSRGRRGIRKGLKHCTVELVPSQRFGPLSYQIYAETQLRYGLDTDSLLSYKRYCRQVMDEGEYAGREYWCCFLGARLAAYATTVRIDDAVVFGATKSDPSTNKYCPNNALFYEVTRHYLADPSVKYLTNGVRTLWHPTDINEFLERLGYRKVYCKLNVVLGEVATWARRARAADLARSIERISGIRNRYLSQLGGLARLLDVVEQQRIGSAGVCEST